MKSILRAGLKLATIALAAIAAVLPMTTMAEVAARIWRSLTEPQREVFAQFGANTLTGLIPTLFEAMNVVSREMTGYITAVTSDSNAERAAKDQIVRVPIGEAGAVEDVTPGQMPANTGDTTPTYADVVITKSRAAPIKWNGEEQLAMGHTGVYNKLLADQFADGMRKLVNEIEVDLGICVKNAASRAYGTAGTTPFATANDLTDFAGPLRILKDNGAPPGNLQMVLGSAAMFNIRGKQSSLFKVNEAGSADLLRDGMTNRVQTFALRESAGVPTHTKGTGTSYVTSGSTAVGVTDVALVTGSGTVVTGDVVTFAADANNKYVVKTGVAAAGTISLNKPGARVVIATANAMTIGANYTANAAFARTAVVLAARAPALPEGGDSAEDRMMLSDPMTGLSFEVSVYRQYRQIKYEIAIAWGVAAIKPEHITTLLG